MTVATVDKIHSVCGLLEKFLDKRHVSYDEALQVILSVKPVDEILEDMVLEDEH